MIEHGLNLGLSSRRQRLSNRREGLRLAKGWLTVRVGLALRSIKSCVVLIERWLTWLTLLVLIVRIR